MTETPSSPFDLDEKVALVTGASAGLGEHFARVLHGAGATVVLVARRHERLQALAEEHGSRMLPLAGDVANAADRRRVVETVLERFGRIDVLINNAGIATAGYPPFADEDLEHVQRILDLNVRAAFALCQLVGAGMCEARSGVIVNVGSVTGLVGPPSDVAYATSKAAIAGLTRSLAVQWAPRGVRVNCLAPGFFPTDITSELFASPRGQEWLTSRCPMRRTGRLEELDAALLFLCAPTSTYYTGQVLAIDGGWTAG